MAILRPLGGKSRRYVDVETGATYSRRQRDIIVGRKPSDKRASSAQKTKRYYELLDSFIDKQIEEGKYKPNEKARDKKRGLRKQARESKEMKQIVKDLKSKDPFMKLRALKQTTRRDGVPDTIPVGETPSVYSGGM